MYRHFFKRLMDILLSGVALILLSFPMLIVAIAIKIDDPGPVLFRQRRVGRKKNGEITYFNMCKFRSMKMSAPHDTPTHLLADPDQYITRVGKFIRKTSLDELPQIYQVFTGKLSLIGPRPALWSQDDLVAEREKYGANDLTPGISGWAQINGRDELSIEEKARYDGEYAAALSSGFFRGLFMDIRCLFGTIFSVLRSDGVVEGGTGELQKQAAKDAEQEAFAVKDTEQEEVTMK